MFQRFIAVIIAALLGLAALTACGSQEVEQVSGTIASVDMPPSPTDRDIVTITLAGDTKAYVVGPDVRGGTTLRIGDKITIWWESASGSRRIVRFNIEHVTPTPTATPTSASAS